MSWAVLILHIILCYVPVVDTKWLLLMKYCGWWDDALPIQGMHPLTHCLLYWKWMLGWCLYSHWLEMFTSESVQISPKWDVGNVDTFGWRQLSHSCRWWKCLEGDLERWVCAIDAQSFSWRWCLPDGHHFLEIGTLAQSTSKRWTPARPHKETPLQK